LKRQLALTLTVSLLCGSVAAVVAAPASAATGKPNLTITSVDLSPITPAVGQGVIFSATVKNTGTAATPAGTIIGVAFKLDSKTTVSYSDTSKAALAPGATRVLTANDRPTGNPVTKAAWLATVGKHTVTAWVDNINRIPETNENDNQMTVSFTSRSNLVGNPSFEVPTLAPWTMGDPFYTTGDFTQGTICRAGNQCRTASGADPNYSDTPALAQTISTIAGHTYQVDFYGKALDGLQVDQGIDGYYAGISAYFGTGAGGLSADLDPAGATPLPYWQHASFRGKATGAKTNLQFFAPTSTCCSSQDWALDDVAVVADLVVTKVTASPASPKKGQPVKFSATIKNNGLVATPTAIVGALFRVDGQVVAWSDNTVTSIPAGGSVTVTANKTHVNGVATWTATSGKHNINVQADDVNRIPEANEDNNYGNGTLTVP
jgi:hypothetical protein